MDENKARTFVILDQPPKISSSELIINQKKDIT
jgi:hypothetical protein